MLMVVTLLVASVGTVEAIPVQSDETEQSENDATEVSIGVESQAIISVSPTVRSDVWFEIMEINLVEDSKPLHDTVEPLLGSSYWSAVFPCIISPNAP